MATTQELLKKNTSVDTGTTSAGSAQSSAGGNNILSGAYNTARTDAINQMYDAQKAAREEELKSAYEQSMSAQKAAQEKIAPQYQTSANDLATQYERNRRNFNQQAAGSGINTGAASQAALAQNNEYLRAFGGLRASEGEAQTEAQRKIADLETQYKSAVAASLAENDYNRAGALLDEYNNAYQRDLQNAQMLAQYGDFSLFANLYGQEQADAMAKVWRAQNPELAYNVGQISADEYFAMTGQWPAGYTPPVSNYGWSGWDGGHWGPNSNEKTTATWNGIVKEVAANGLSSTIANIQNNASSLTNPQQALEMAYGAVHSGRQDR